MVKLVGIHNATWGHLQGQDKLSLVTFSLSIGIKLMTTSGNGPRKGGKWIMD